MSVLKDMILDPREMRLVEGLQLQPRKTFAGRVRGERLTQKKGLSIEFADYREYTDGDDLRHLDWNVLARLETPIMKTYRDEEDLAVHLLVDASPSMDFGEPSKIEMAQRLAASLGFIALSGGDAVYTRMLGRKEAPASALRGRASYPRLARWAGSAAPVDETGKTTAPTLATSLRGFLNSSARTGVVILLSDGMDPEAANVLRAIAGRGHELLFLQILSPIELDPDLEGDLRLLDGEGGSPIEITANSYTLKEYKRRFEEHNAALQQAATRGGGRYAQVLANDSLEHVVKEILKRQRWVA